MFSLRLDAASFSRYTGSVRHLLSGHKSIGRWLLAAALACAVAALFVVTQRAQPPRLMDRATRMPSWGEMDRAFPLPGPALMRLHPDWDTDSRTGDAPETFRLDTSTGVETPLVGLDAVLAKHDNDHWQVSSDGRTLLFSSSDFVNGGIGYDLCGLDGAGLTRIPRPVIGNEAVWLRDGRGWACLDGGLDWDRHATLVVNRLGSPREQRLPLSGTPEAIRRVAEQETLLGFRADGHALVWTFAPGYKGNGEGTEASEMLADFAVAPGATIHLASVPLPQGVSLDWLLLSPRGDRLACLTSRETPSRWPRLLQPLLRRLGVKTPPSQTLELWVSDLDGRNRRLVGGLTTSADTDEVELTQWTGDERTLTFEHHGDLYAVPVD